MRNDVAAKLAALIINESQAAFGKETDAFCEDRVAFRKLRMDLISDANQAPNVVAGEFAPSRPELE
jgi:hypothetical protein